MDTPTLEDYERCYDELAQFCFNKLANLEARFVILCHRAEALGIDTEDIKGVKVVDTENAAPLRALN
jgi:hypothetical protein